MSFRLCEIEKVNWKITSDMIEEVLYDQMRYLYFIKLKGYGEVEMPNQIWNLFKREFPEHCLDIKEYHDIPF